MIRFLLLFGLAILAITPRARAADDLLLTRSSQHSVADTVARFEAALRARGWVVFTEIDHAAAARQAGLSLDPRIVVVFGNPKAGTPQMQAHPTLAIDLPMKALVWQDDAGKVWLTQNSAEYMARQIYPRHQMTIPPDGVKGLQQMLDELARAATE
jgi:uncharacterized protein (DUF302 family)